MVVAGKSSRNSTKPTMIATYSHHQKTVVESKCDTGSATTIHTTSTKSSSSNMIHVDAATSPMTMMMKPKTYTTTTTTTTPSNAEPPPRSDDGPKLEQQKQQQQQIRNGWFRWLFGGFRVRPNETASRSTSFGNNDTTTINTTTTGSNKKKKKKKNPATSSYLRLARERRFDDIEMVLTHSSPTFVASWLQVQQESRSSICECLHAICMYRPTSTAVQVVQTAIKAAHQTTASAWSASPVNQTLVGTTTTVAATATPTFDCIVNPTLVTDAYGRTPLHIAVACGCSFHVVEVLLQDDVEAAYMMDHTNRYPLHWACCCAIPSSATLLSSSKNQSASKEHEVDNVIKIVNRLMEIYAMAIISKDDMGCTPLDLAKSTNAHPRILSALQFVQNILPVKKRIKSSPDEVTVITNAVDSKYPMREAICIYYDDENYNIDHDPTFMDDVSSIGSRGVSKCRSSRLQSRTRRATRSESPKRSNRIRELVHI